MNAIETSAPPGAFRIADIPGRHEKLRLHIADTVGAWIAGAHTAEGKALKFAEQRGGLPCTTRPMTWRATARSRA